MSIESVARVLRLPKMDQTEKLIMIGIANHDGDGGSWPSVETLGSYACVSQRHARRIIRSLEERGWIKVEPNGGGSQKTKSHERPNLYHIKWDVVEGPPDTAVSPPDTAVSPPPGHSCVRTPPDIAVSPEPSFEPSINRPRTFADLSVSEQIRERLVKRYGEPITSGQVKVREAQIKQFVNMGIEPVEVSRRADMLKQKWPKCENPIAVLLQRWDTYAPPTPGQMYGV